MNASTIVDVSVASDADGIPGDDEIAAWVNSAIETLDEDAIFEVSVRIVDEDEGRALNEQYRDKAGPTNVLSFPAGEAAPGLGPDVPRALGDIVVCAPVVLREAAEQDKALDAHWAHLLVHGTLHLFGFDHADEQDAEVMEAHEKQILEGHGFADPYVQ